MKNLFIIAFIIIFLTTACSNKQPEVVIETNEAQNVSTEQVVEKLHPIEQKVRDCIDKDYSTVGMNKCVYEGMKAWEKEIDKYLNLLKSTLPEEDFEKIKKSQEEWEEYKEAQFRVAEIMLKKNGTMHQNVAIGLKSGIIEERAKELESFYNLWKL